MKRQKRRTASKRKDGASPATPTAQPEAPRKKARSRRNFLQNIGYYVVGAGLVGGGGWYFINNVQAGIAEQDLSRLGNGIPTVVQIHDPQCPMCRALQAEARAAISEFDSGQIQFLVANIREPEGRQLAAAHGVGHVTLLLFDGSGRRQGVLVGEKKSEFLVDRFRSLIRQSGSS